MSKTSRVKQISENLPSVPNSPPSTLFGHCADWDSTRRCIVGTILITYNGLWWGSVLRRVTPQRRIKMKTLLVMGAFLLVLPIAGCTATVSPTPAAATPGPAGPQGQSGQTGKAGQPGQQGDPGQSGQQGQPGDQGQPGQTGQQGRQGKEAPCPAGEHRYTNPDTGKVSCVRD